MPSLKIQISRELDRLRMWRDVASDIEIERETELAHERINRLLDSLDAANLAKRQAEKVPG
jgi:hypothetical protein